jgi:hypothetical protein
MEKDVRRLFACLFAISSSIAAPGLLVTSASAQVNCGPDAPPAHLRPGGFCDNSASGKSLTGPNNEGCGSFQYVFPRNTQFNFEGDAGQRVHLAANCDVDCSVYYQQFHLPAVLPEGPRVHVAQVDIPDGCQTG